jgi:ATP-binding cassette subfamily B multidrug efflux pump
MLTWPVTAIGWIASIIQQAAASQNGSTNSWKHSQRSPVLVEETSALPLQGKGRVRSRLLRLSRYRYPGLERRFFHRLEPGEKMAIVGPYGFGEKYSWLIYWCGMYDVSEGQIRIDDKDIREHDLYHLRQQIGYVPQDVFLFSDTVARNVAFGRANATLTKRCPRYTSMQRFTCMRSANSLLRDLRRWWESGASPCQGDKSNGCRSPGPSSRNPNILLLDDCLSAVDANTEKQILGYL